MQITPSTDYYAVKIERVSCPKNANGLFIPDPISGDKFCDTAVVLHCPSAPSESAMETYSVGDRVLITPGTGLEYDRSNSSVRLLHRDQILAKILDETC